MSGFHITNKGIKTSNFDLHRCVFHFAVDGSGDPTTIYQAGANFVSSVTHAGAGSYIVVLNKPYPTRLIAMQVSLSTPAATDDLRRICYKANDYTSADGDFEIMVSAPTADNDASQLATDPIDGSEIHVSFDFITMTTGIGN